MKKWIISLTMAMAFCIFTGSTLDGGSVPLPGTTPADTAATPKPMTTADKIRAKRLNIPLDTAKGDFAQQVLAMENEPLAGTDMEARIDKVQHDNIGYTHVRLQQYYKGIPVDGATKIVHINKRNVLYDVDGAFARRLNVDVTPKLTAQRAEEIALEDARMTVCTDGHCSQWKDAVEAMVAKFDLLSSTGQEPAAVAEAAHLLIAEGALVYEVMVKERGVDNADWSFWIDAVNGQVARKYNAIAYYAPPPPSSAGIDTTVKGVKLHREIDPATNDSTPTMQGWKVTSEGNYYLYSPLNSDSDTTAKKGPWGVYNAHNHFGPDTTDTACHWIRSASPNWGTTDRAAISAAKNTELVQRYITDSLGQWSFDSAGNLLMLYIHCVKQSDPNVSEYSNTEHAIYTGDGDGTKNSHWGVLDQIGHEAGHAVTCHNSNLDGTKQASRALMESFSDIMGAAVEFAYQRDSKGNWPSSVAGTADWLYGEDVALSSPTLRDFRYAQRDTSTRHLRYATWYEGSYYAEDGDTSAPHDMNVSTAYQKMGVQCFAFYLLAEGNDSLRYNDGHEYGIFSGIGVASAARVAMRANMHYLSAHATLQDSRNAWLDAAVDLIDEGKLPGNADEAVEDAWDAVGVFPELRLARVGEPNMQISRTGNFHVGDTTANTYGGQPHAFRFKYKGTLKASLYGKRFCYVGDTLVESSGSFLDNGSNLVGGITIKAPDGKVQWFVDSLGNVRTRGAQRWNAF